MFIIFQIFLVKNPEEIFMFSRTESIVVFPDGFWYPV